MLKGSLYISSLAVQRCRQTYFMEEMNIRYLDLELCDIHMHIVSSYSLIPVQDFQMPACDNAASIIDIMEKCRLHKVNILAVSLYEPVDLVCNPLALYTKTLSPGRVFALAGLRRSLTAAENRNSGRQAEDLIKAGFDGFKLICKPNVRRKFNFAMNDPMFDDLKHRQTCSRKKNNHLYNANFQQCLHSLIQQLQSWHELSLTFQQFYSLKLFIIK